MKTSTPRHFPGLDKISDLYGQAEEIIAALKYPYDVNLKGDFTICWIKIGGKRRLCAKDSAAKTDEPKPITDCSVNIRLTAYVEIPYLYAEIKKKLAELVPTVESAAAEFENMIYELKEKAKVST